MPARLSVIVPAYNEAATIEQTLRAVAAEGFDAEILVVDDGSTDGTQALVESLAGEIDGLRLIQHEHNRGKGAAVRSATPASAGDMVVIQDADLEYNPRTPPRLLEPLFEGHADVVYGTRLRGGPHPQRAHLFWHYLGNRFLSLLTDILFNTTISDMEVGYKAFRGDLVRSLRLESADFGFEPEVTAKVLKIPDVRVYEVPISYYGRSFAEGKKITWRDGIGAVRVLVRHRFLD